MSEKNIDTMVVNLKQKGYKVPKNVAESINGIGFRLLEQVRLGNKDNVFYMLLRCFKASEEKFPDELVEAFKPENEEYFKTLIFSFLAPILGEGKQTEVVEGKQTEVGEGKQTEVSEGKQTEGGKE